MKDLNVNIHIGGAMRTGKTTLAKKLRTELAKMGYTSGLIDVDQTRTLTFGKDEPVLGNLDPKSRPEDVAPFQLQKKMQAWSYGNIFEVQIPLVVNAGAIPIFAATHAGPAYVDGKPVPIYDRLEQIANKLGNKLCLILLEATTVDEMAKRCMNDADSNSDMVGDPRENPTLLENWRTAVERIKQSYADCTKPLIWIPQGTPEEMADKALAFVLEGMAVSA